MELETSPLMEEVDKILKDGPKKVFYKWEVEFRVREPNPVKISDAEYDGGLPILARKRIGRPVEC